jgi:hypothetical protein
MRNNDLPYNNIFHNQHGLNIYYHFHLAPQASQVQRLAYWLNACVCLSFLSYSNIKYFFNWSCSSSVSWRFPKSATTLEQSITFWHILLLRHVPMWDPYTTSLDSYRAAPTGLSSFFVAVQLTTILSIWAEQYFDALFYRSAVFVWKYNLNVLPSVLMVRPFFLKYNTYFSKTLLGNPCTHLVIKLSSSIFDEF